jgi:hypothetical protein
MIFSILFIVGCVASIALPAWYSVHVDLSKINGVNVNAPNSACKNPSQDASGKWACDGQPNVKPTVSIKSLDDKVYWYGVELWCQNYARLQSDGTCTGAPFWLLGTFNNDNALTYTSKKADGSVMDKSIDGKLASSTDACCVGYKNNLLVNGTFTINIGTDVPHTTEGLAIFALVLQILGFLALMPATCCCLGCCSTGIAAFFIGLAGFFYMVTGAYWANMLSSESNVYPTYCSTAKREYRSAFLAYPNTLSTYKSDGMDSLVHCGSFISYWCMWVNFTLCFLMLCCLSYAAHKAKDIVPHEEGESIALNTHGQASYS